MIHTRSFWRNFLPCVIPLALALVPLLWLLFSSNLRPLQVLAALVLPGLAIAWGYWHARRLTLAIMKTKEAIDQITLDNEARRDSADEVGSLDSLAEAIGVAARKIKERSSEAEQQRIEHDSVISAMLEGVIVVDVDEKLVSVNPAAAELFHFDRLNAIGKSLQEVIRNSELHRLVTRTLTQRTAIESDITLSEVEERYLQATSTILADTVGREVGVLIVLNDVTRLHKLERVRRDFVANVSHELKTPITSIKGYVETLLDGAFRDPADAERFLNTIARQSNRLNAIIEDLLKLSRIEQGVEKGEIPLEKATLRGVLSAAVTACESHAKDKNTAVALSCLDDLKAKINPPLLEQAIINLIDNAVKYNPAGTTIEVIARQEAAAIVIEIRDNGVGIDSEHLPRLFERFYRVDKSRSRSEGGTGLGLAITKHIVLAHGGTISVSSQVGAGSTFTISVPC